MSDKQLEFWAHMLDESMGEKGIGPLEAIDKFAKDRGLVFVAGDLGSWNVRQFETFAEADKWFKLGDEVSDWLFERWHKDIRSAPWHYDLKTHEESDGISTWQEYDSKEIEKLARSKAEEEIVKSAEAAEKQVKTYSSQSAEPNFFVFAAGKSDIDEDDVFCFNSAESDFGIGLIYRTSA